jgi:anthranilate/para-aminobenzoate synthase component I
MEWMSDYCAPHVDGLPPFWGGLVGYFGYDASQYVDERIAHLMQARKDAPEKTADDFQDFEFGFFDQVGVVDHFRKRLWLVDTVLLPKGTVRSPAAVERMYRSAQNRLRRQAVRLQRAIRSNRSWGEFQADRVRSNKSEAAYRLMVRRAKGFIEAGDIYQANLSQRFNGVWKGNPWALYRHLSRINPSPYAGLWRSGSKWIVSSSPELLVRKEKNQLETRPIAGTLKRTQGQLEEERVKQFLRDQKENAEHVMLVDLERNDLSRICKSPSVRVEEALTVEAYSHVYHLVSDVRGELLPGKTWKDVFAAVFPGGTITGCPKLSCMELIERLEKAPRGPYTGSMGWIGFDGDMTMNILIRSFYLTAERFFFSVGAGIVADSVPEKEYQETLQKAAALFQALQTHQTLPLFPNHPF